MAFELTAELIGAPLIDALRRHRPGLAQKAETAAAWLREIAEPPRGVELRSADGTSYTGFVIVERNKPVIMLAVRHPAGPVIERAPVITPAPQHRSPYPHSLDPDVPFWDRDSVPYGR